MRCRLPVGIRRYHIKRRIYALDNDNDQDNDSRREDGVPFDKGCLQTRGLPVVVLVRFQSRNTLYNLAVSHAR